MSKTFYARARTSQMIRRSTCRRTGFTLVELLVVIAVIGMLVVLVLPGLQAARDHARAIVCASNMRQVYIYSAAFKTDIEALLPSTYDQRYPNGPTPGCPTRNGLPNLIQQVHFGWMLMDFDYINSAGAYYDYTDDYNAGMRGDELNKQIFANTRDSILACPDAVRGGGKTFVQNSTLSDMRAMSSFRRTYNAALVGKSGRRLNYASIYEINREAGAMQYYVSKRENDGYFPIRGWVSSPESVGYIFENNVGVDSVHWPSDRKTPNGGSWHSGNRGFPGYNPTAPHYRRTKSNMIHGDGHHTTLGDAYGGADNPPIPFKWY